MLEHKIVVCPKCGKPIPEPRYRLGYRTCVKCSDEQQIKQVEISASSLQWI